tara:strand:- start:215 stop:571 length:357 start_codon:yes stop_codon:yes gene_type:complete
MKKIIYLITITLLLTVLTGCNTDNFNTYRNDDIINLNGKLAMVGNYPFESIALRLTTDYQIKLIFKTKKDYSFISNKIGKDAKVKGKLKIHKLKTADSKKEITEYRLIVDKIKVKELF